MSTEIQRAAQVLSEQYRSNQLFILPNELVPASTDEAYSIQRQFQTNISCDQGPIAGYKLAYTTAILQQANGVSGPCMGIMLANNIRQSPCTLAAADFVQLGIECEVAARLGSDLPPSGAPYDRAKVSTMRRYSFRSSRRPDTTSTNWESGRRPCRWQYSLNLLSWVSRELCCSPAWPGVETRR